VQELAGTLVVDDSKSKFPLSPKAVLAFELGDGEADGGQNKGTYLELGVKPGIKLAPKATLYVPVKTGLSVNHYYEGPTGDNTFGYFDLGAQLSVPVVSGKSGALEIHGGIDFLWLGDNMKLLNNGDTLKPVSLIGMTFTY
jgi:nucleoside-specific outer membrane channel protein Tsx